MLPRYAAGLLIAARHVAPAALLAWAYALALSAVEARAWPGLHALCYAGGILALWTMTLAVLLMALSAPWARRLTEPCPPGRRPTRTMIAAAGVATLCAIVTVRWGVPRVARGMAEIPQLVHAASFYGGAAMACAGALGVQVALQRHLRNLPLWLLPLAFALARLASTDALQVISVSREHLVEIAAILAGTVGLLGVRLRPAMLPLAAAGAAGLLWTVATLGSFAVAADRLNDRMPGPAALVRAARSYVDLDGDGYSAVLGGMDCDDADARIGPGALEVVGNGIDDNCIGGDAKSATRRTPPHRGPATPAAADTADAAGGLRRSVVLITIDAWNHGMLPAEPPAGPDPMPRVRAFAAGGAHFTRAYSQANATTGGLTALHTGRYPMNSRVGLRDLGMEPPLAALLSAAGHNTAAAVALGRARTWPLRQGFMLLDDRVAVDGPYTRSAQPLTEVSLSHLAELEAAKAPYFYWVHYTDPHLAYVERDDTPFDGQTRWDRYRQEVFAVDREVGKLLDQLEAWGFLQRGIVAITGDHGESLSQRSPYGHAWWLFEDCIRTPLVIRGAGVTAGSFDHRVRLVDVAPTLLSLAAGYTVDADGRDLAPVWQGREQGDRVVLSQMNYYGHLGYALVDGNHKLITDFFLGTEALYDLAADPGEQRNLIDAHPGEAKRLRDMIGERVDDAMNDRVLAARFGQGATAYTQ